jgi:hypothetical protein
MLGVVPPPVVALCSWMLGSTALPGVVAAVPGPAFVPGVVAAGPTLPPGVVVALPGVVAALLGLLIV